MKFEQRPYESIATLGSTVAAVLLCLSHPQVACAQGTLRFDAFIPGEIIAEQFASRGIHFHSPNTSNPPIVTSSSVPPKENLVGLSRDVLWISTDYPIASLTIALAIPRGSGSAIRGDVLINAFDATGALVDDRDLNTPLDEWAPLMLTFEPHRAVTKVELEGLIDVAGQPSPSGFYFDEIQITAVPEVSTLTLSATGAVLILCSKRRASVTH